MLIRAAVAAAVVAAVSAAPALAHPSPAGCNASGLGFDIQGHGILKRNGDVISVTGYLRNTGAGVCDITDAIVTMSFPTSAGMADGQQLVLATDLDLPAGTALTEIGTRDHTVNFDPGVFRGPVGLSVSGTTHFSGGDITGAIGSASSPLVISRPHVTMSVAPSAMSGDSPLAVTYTYSAHNDSPADPNLSNPAPGLSAAALTDDTCSPVSAPSGDTNSNTVLDPGETWTWTCGRTFFGGAFTNHATLAGTSTRDGRPWPATTAESTVNVNGPDMTLVKSHTGTFTQGDVGRTYSIVATNSGNRSSTGTVSVADSLPPGLAATEIAGDGWACDLGTLTCTRSDTLAAGASYPPITLTVNVASNAAETVVNTATVSRAGENVANNGASDPTTVARVQSPGGGSPGPGDTPPLVPPVLCAGKVATIVGTKAGDTLRGTRRRDVIAALGGNDSVRAGGGNDLVCGGGGRDTLRGDAGKDTLRGGAGRDRLLGGKGRDRLLGGPGRDIQRQ